MFNTYPTAVGVRVVLGLAALALLNALALVQVEKVFAVALMSSFLLDRQFESSFDKLRARVLYARRRVRGRLQLTAAGAVGIAGGGRKRPGRRFRRIIPEVVIVQRVRHGDEGVEYLGGSRGRAARLHRQKVVDCVGG